jgi:hypothetical protein
MFRGASVLNLTGSAVEIGETIAAIEAVVPRISGLITHDDTALPFRAEVTPHNASVSADERAFGAASQQQLGGQHLVHRRAVRPFSKLPQQDADGPAAKLVDVLVNRRQIEQPRPGELTPSKSASATRPGTAAPLTPTYARSADPQ